jgi:hypothetical protein
LGQHECAVADFAPAVPEHIPEKVKSRNAMPRMANGILVLAISRTPNPMHALCRGTIAVTPSESIVPSGRREARLREITQIAGHHASKRMARVLPGYSRGVGLTRAGICGNSNLDGMRGHITSRDEM